jgi:hypothetical protein
VVWRNLLAEEFYILYLTKNKVNWKCSRCEETINSHKILVGKLLKGGDHFGE